MSLFVIDPASPSYVALRETGEHIVRRDDAGYYVYYSRGITHLMHRVVFELTHGFCPKVVDHKNGDKGDNRPENLRDATHTTNKWNVGVAAHNTSGVKGLSWNNRRACWVGRVCHDGRVAQRYSKDRAVVESWLVYTRNKLHGEFANHG